MPGVLKKIFSLEMVENDFCLGGASKQNALFSENVPQKDVPMHPMSRIGPEYSGELIPILDIFLKLLRLHDRIDKQNHLISFCE